MTIFSLKLFSKKIFTTLNYHCVDTIKKIDFFHVGHCIANASNLMPHLTCCYYLVFAFSLQFIPNWSVWMKFKDQKLKPKPKDKVSLKITSLFNILCTYTALIFLWRILAIMCKTNKLRIFFLKFPVFKKIFKKMPQSAYNMKGCLRLSTFIFCNKAKFG